MAEAAPVEGSIRWHSGTGKWQQNWFCLKTTPESGTGAPSLVYSKARSTPPLGSISLAVLHKVTPADGADVSGWKQEYQGRCVQVEVGGEDGGAASTAIHYLLADNRGEMLRWMKALSKIKGAQRKESLRTTLASVSKGAPSSPTASTTNADSTAPSLSPPPESRPRAASRSSSSPALPASQPATPTTNEAGARPLSGRAKRQAILLNKPLRFGAQAGDSPAQDAPDANNKDPAAVGDGAPAVAATETQALSTAKSKMQELEERRRLITSRASVSVSAAATTNAAADDGGAGAESDNSSAQQRLREMELKAEQRRKQAEELVAKRQAAAQMLQQRKAAPRAAPASPDADAADSAEKEETETKAEAEKEASGYHSWKARKNENEAQLNMQKMLVGELQAKILPKQAQQQQAEAAGVDRSDSDSDSADDDDDGRSRRRVEESSELASAAAEASGERGTGEGDDEGERAKPQDEAVVEARERVDDDDDDEKEREERDDDEQEKEKEELEQRQKEEEEEEAMKKRREEEERKKKEDEEAEEERQRQEHEQEEKRKSEEEERKQLEEARRKEEREREEEEERKRRQQEEAEAEAEEEERKREEEKERKQLEEERRKATEEEEERKRKAAKEEEEDVKERQRRREEEAEEARLQAERKAEEDKRKTDELEKQKKTGGDEGKATDELLKQRVEEIEEKKKRMFERMRQREKNRRDSGSAAAAGFASTATAPKSESGGEAKLAEEAKNEELNSSEKSESDGGEEGNEQKTKERRQSGLFAKQPPPAAPQPQPSPVDEAAAESEKKEAMRKMLEMLSKQKAERAEERERLKKMLEERKKKKVEEYAHLRSDNQSSPPSGAQAGSANSVDTTTTATAVTVDRADEDHHQQQRQQQQQQEELRKLKEEMRSIRSTIVLLDRESDTLNERIAQVHVQELQERRERERQAREEQSRLEHAMREEMMRAQALEVLLERYVPLHTPHEVLRHEQHILDETTHNAVLVNLSGILLARGRSHGNWFAHELGRTTLADDSSADQIGEDDERVLRLKGGIVVRKRDSASEWDLLALPEGAVMLLDREPSGLNSSTVSLGDQEQTDDHETPATTASAPRTGEDDGEQVKRVFFNLADAPSEPDHLSPAKKALLVDLRQAVNNIVEHFSAAGSDQQMAALGEETASNKAITRLVRGELSTILAGIFDVGFKSWKFFGAYHLWDFLEAYGQQNDSVRELAALGLRNAIKTLNTNVRMTENPNIKFRALICHGLNNKYLDEWVSLLLAHNGLMNKWYNDESLLRDARASEAVVKSLGRLKNFPFAMDINFEVRPAVVRRIDSERAAAQQSAAPTPTLSVDTAPLDDEARMRMRGVTGGSAARAAAAAAAAAQVLSVGGVDASNRRQSAWGRPRNSELVLNSEPKNENENEHEAKAAAATTATSTTPTKGVTLWGSLWGGDQGQQHTSVDPDELKRIDKRRGKERVRGSNDSEFLDELDEVPRLELVDEDFKIEIKEIEPGQPDRGSPGVSFFTSFLDLAKSMVDDNDD